MKTWLKVALITIVLSIPAFMLGPILWPPHEAVQPTPAQLPWFILLSVIEAVAFGAGVSFLILAYKRFAGKGMHARLAYASIGWLLVSWWPHDNNHIHNGLETAGLLRIDYTFHVTLIIASAIVATYVYGLLKK